MSELQEQQGKSPFKARGTFLPKVPLRPFWGSPKRIDDKEYAETSPRDKKLLLFLPVIFIYGGGGFCLLVWLASVLANDPHWFMLLGGLALLAVAGWGHWKLRRMKPTEFYVFDREKGVFRAKVGFPGRVIEMPFVESEGRLGFGPGPRGVPGYDLSIHHPTLGGWSLLQTVGSNDLLLSYWSFLVQYMDKTKPLPDVPWLHDYPNRTKGWGTTEEWEARKKSPNFIDPWHEWEAIVSQNPKLDSNYYIEHPEELAQWNGKPPWSMNGEELVDAGIMPEWMLPPDEQELYRAQRGRKMAHGGVKRSP